MTTTTTATIKGRCSGCSSLRKVTKNGTMPRHGVPGYGGRYAPTCDGSYRKPTELVEVKPKKKSKPRNWCGACLRDVAEDTGRYAHDHGYQRPGWGYHVGGCSGRGHKVLGESNSAIVAELNAVTKAVGYWLGQLGNRSSLTTEQFEAWRAEREAEHKAKVEKLGRWNVPRLRLPFSQDEWVREARSHLNMALSHEHETKARLAAWRKGTTAKEQIEAITAAKAEWHRVQTELWIAEPRYRRY